jgi:hypothetical protein
VEHTEQPKPTVSRVNIRELRELAARAKQLKSRRLDVKLDPGILQALVGEIIHERERRYQEVHHRGRQAPKPKPFEPKPGQARRITDAE